MQILNVRKLKAGFIAYLVVITSSVLAQTKVSDNELPASTWSTTSAEHVYGLPDVKAGKKGTLTLDPDSLTFTSKSSKAVILRDQILAVSDGSDRVELWGTTGQVMRMLIPDGGGLAAGAVLHHRVGMLTVDFLDPRGGKHGAVFDMTPAQADAAVAIFSKTPVEPHPLAQSITCRNTAIDPASVLVLSPHWEAADVPAAYRALVFEHVVTRLKAGRGVNHVYRYGEVIPGNVCPAYTVQISVKSFKPGNQIKRASLGPIGMFVGTTQIAFDFNLTDASGRINQNEEIKTSMRMQSESTAVADMFAKSLAKHYIASLKKEEETMKKQPALTTGNSFK
jgi:hypothetical protein